MDAKTFTRLKALDLKSVFHKTLDIIYGKDEVDSFFFLCIEHYLNVPKFQLALEPEFTLNKRETDTFFEALEQLKQQKPIQYILGETEFYGLKFKVNQNVLIPRPETEELVDWIIKSSKFLDVTSSAVEKSQTQALKPNTSNLITILDIGTGSGCIAISLAKHLPNAKVYALDISEEALKVAKENAKQNNVDIEFINADILVSDLDSSLWEDVALPQMGFFDIIVSNPPYVRNLEKQDMQLNVLDHEPHLALFVDDENPLVFYKAITNFAVNNLKPNGQLYFEINQYLGEDTKQLLMAENFSAIELRKDSNGNDRMLRAVIPAKAGISNK